MEDGVACLAVADSRAHFYEFVVGKRPVQFSDEVWRDAALSDQYDGIAVVAQPAKVLALGFGEGHGGSRGFVRGYGVAANRTVIGSRPVV